MAFSAAASGEVGGLGGHKGLHRMGEHVDAVSAVTVGGTLVVSSASKMAMSGSRLSSTKGI